METLPVVEGVGPEVARRLEGLKEDERARRMRGILESMADPRLHVVVFGEFNRGKSTLINALLGRVVLPARLVPTTGQVTRVRDGETEEVSIFRRDGGVERRGLAELDAVASLRLDGGSRADVERIEVRVASPLLHDGLVLTDTPGLNDAEAQTRRSLEEIRSADAVFFVLDARQLLDQSERRLSFEWLTGQLHKPVVPVVNFMNFLADDERAAIRQRLEHWCGPAAAEPFALRWYEVDALGALRHALARGPAPGDDFEALRASLLACRGEVRAALQRRSRAGALAAELEEVRAENRAALDRLRAAAEQAARQREEERLRLSHARARLEAGTRTQREHLRLTARRILGEKLDSLTGTWYRGETRARLDERAADWYRDRLSEAVAAIETKANAALAALAEDGLSRPDTVSIQDRVDLELSPPPPAADDDVPVGAATALGALIGTFILPGVGTALGAMAGRRMAAAQRTPRADPVEVFSAAARGGWADAAERVLGLLEEQLDTQSRQWKAEMDGRLLAASSAGASHDSELADRAALDDCLAPLG